jgi:metal-responsive CopG/Arc/MetJ family transcriptional regulator
MAVRPTLVQLPPELIDRLDRRAVRERVSRSQVVREAVNAYLRTDAEDEVAESYRKGYDAIPYGTPDEWGDVDAFHAELARQRRSSPPGRG